MLGKMRMIYLNKFTIKYRLFKFSSNANFEDYTNILNYTADEEQKILDTINTSNNEQLASFDISKSRSKSLENWKIKKGPFKSLAEILEVDNLGSKVVQKLCNSIIDNKTSKTPKSRRGQFLVPALTASQINFLQSAVGFQIGVLGISWAKIDRFKNKLQDWNFYGYADNFPKKILPNDTFKLALTILNDIPPADVYIFEAVPIMSPSNTKQSTVISYNQHLELSSMLLALINTSTKYAPNQKGDNNSLFDTRVYFLKTNIAARLFKTLMGNERVSSTNIVANILKTLKMGSDSNLPHTFPSIDNKLQEHYFNQDCKTQELLGQALLLIISFMDLCVHKNSVSISSITRSSKKGRTF